ncbi:YveK family protein [Mariniplasma anaerobium]|uniref:Capsular polysaccharide biosynthesis protein CpsC n=1 Tax=Mariniplasma anaerobium TaxID=2735436 RepID=A0A7U9TH01_9MOLU|nr:Wzz/FepE/Etk N-terminal domain-containing protein [Mariniplasma anaerobium]BCR36290.1 capsular polysaccharide biosynthesis protein CpsC [Mariniplasma anaerobium]
MEQELIEDTEIDLIHLIKLILKKWILIGIVTVAIATAVGLYAYIALDDVYTAESSMIVQVTSSTDSEYTALLTGQRLVDTYSEIAESNRVLEALKVNLGIDYTNSQLRGMISVNSVNDTLIINLSVESTDPVLAGQIANELVSIVKDLSNEFEGLENVEVLDTALTPVSPSGPNRMLYLVVGISLGGMLGVGIVLAIEFLCKDIKTGRDIEKVLGLRLLGLIPDYSMDEELK